MWIWRLSTRVPDYFDCDRSLIEDHRFMSEQKDLTVLKRIRDGDVSQGYSDSGASRTIQEGSLCERSTVYIKSIARANTGRAFQGRLPFLPERRQP